LFCKGTDQTNPEYQAPKPHLLSSPKVGRRIVFCEAELTLLLLFWKRKRLNVEFCPGSASPRFGLWRAFNTRVGLRSHKKPLYLDGLAELVEQCHSISTLKLRNVRLCCDSHYSFPRNVRTLSLSSCDPVSPTKTHIFSGETSLHMPRLCLSVLDQIQFQWPKSTVQETSAHRPDEVLQLVRAKNVSKLALKPRLVLSMTTTPTAMAESAEVLHLNSMPHVGSTRFKKALEPYISGLPNLKEVLTPSLNIFARYQP
jgi:hypothetical protein